MINFTVGPVQMDDETRELGGEQIPYFRTEEFSKIMLENEKLLCKFFDATENSHAIFMTGSGTSSMEGAVMNFFTKEDKVLVVNGGSFGKRLVELCEIHEIPYSEIKLGFGVPLTEKDLKPYVNNGYTGFLVQLCETSTGILYDLNLIGNFCKKNNIFLFVDAVSGFMADEISIKKMHINAAITGSQKALALPPGMSFTILDDIAIKKCKSINVNSLYFNYPNYLANIERGQTPFTPAVSTLLMLNKKLKKIETSGGIKEQNRIVKERADYFRKSIKNLPFRMFTSPEYSSNCVTALCPVKTNISAYKIFEIIKNEYDIWVCPNGGELADKVFRVGHIGSISKKNIDKLIEAFKDLENRKII